MKTKRGAELEVFSDMQFKLGFILLSLIATLSLMVLPASQAAGLMCHKSLNENRTPKQAFEKLLSLTDASEFEQELSVTSSAALRVIFISPNQKTGDYGMTDSQGRNLLSRILVDKEKTKALITHLMNTRLIFSRQNEAAEEVAQRILEYAIVRNQADMVDFYLSQVNLNYYRVTENPVKVLQRASIMAREGGNFKIIQSMNVKLAQITEIRNQRWMQARTQQRNTLAEEVPLTDLATEETLAAPPPATLRALQKLPAQNNWKPFERKSFDPAQYEIQVEELKTQANKFKTLLQFGSNLSDADKNVLKARLGLIEEALNNRPAAITPEFVQDHLQNLINRGHETLHDLKSAIEQAEKIQSRPSGSMP